MGECSTILESCWKMTDSCIAVGFGIPFGVAGMQDFMIPVDGLANNSKYGRQRRTSEDGWHAGKEAQGTWSQRCGRSLMDGRHLYISCNRTVAPEFYQNPIRIAVIFVICRVRNVPGSPSRALALIPL